MQVQHYLENWETTVWNIFYAAFYCFRIREIEDQSGINGKPVSPLTTGRYDLLLKLMHDKDLRMEVEFEDVEGDRGRFHWQWRTPCSLPQILWSLWTSYHSIAWCCRLLFDFGAGEIEEICSDTEESIEKEIPKTVQEFTMHFYLKIDIIRSVVRMQYSYI